MLWHIDQHDSPSLLMQNEMLVVLQYFILLAFVRRSIEACSSSFETRYEEKKQQHFSSTRSLRLTALITQTLLTERRLTAETLHDALLQSTHTHTHTNYNQMCVFSCEQVGGTGNPDISCQFVCYCA